ncbi:hypothetical protein NA56DRAFT_75020 [Hyaloscypha hepaticicola]|uniref:Uncharacterized protein n=1 Tax=Hyaloscypha hepaticicola TaxID=2082293 RepID=A0A2J6Q980_9HELO|nr:hypothetical protein NA56DRAFT_75020 [Hyaloscypha hepaticicola]
MCDTVPLLEGETERAVEECTEQEARTVSKDRGTTVQREYDTHFARLGRHFAVGDDRARAEIAEYVVTLQHAIITLMSESNSSIMLVLPSLPTMYSTSENTRIGVGSTLAEQYQRMVQAMPLGSSSLLPNFTQVRMARPRRTISDSSAVSESCSTPEPSICKANSLQSIYNFEHWNQYGYGASRPFRCRGCRFSGIFHENSNALIIKQRKDRLAYWVPIDQRALFKSHFNVTKSESPAERSLYCPICYDGSRESERVVRYTSPQIIAHIKDTHTYDELDERDLILSYG